MLQSIWSGICSWIVSHSVASRKKKSVPYEDDYPASLYYALNVEDNDATITEKDKVELLREIYKTNGPGSLDWDFSVSGRAFTRSRSFVSRGGRLVSLSLSGKGLRGYLKIRALHTLEALECDFNPALERVALEGLENLAALDISCPFNYVALARRDNLTHLKIKALVVLFVESVSMALVLRPKPRWGK